jgi:hypothetical protein
VITPTHTEVHSNLIATMKLPPNVTIAKVIQNWGKGTTEVWWRVSGNPKTHTFVLPKGEPEDVVLQAAYAAIRLTC